MQSCWRDHCSIARWLRAAAMAQISVCQPGWRPHCSTSRGPAAAVRAGCGFTAQGTLACHLQACQALSSNAASAHTRTVKTPQACKAGLQCPFWFDWRCISGRQVVGSAPLVQKGCSCRDHLWTQHGAPVSFNGTTGVQSHFAWQLDEMDSIRRSNYGAAQHREAACPAACFRLANKRSTTTAVDMRWTVLFDSA